MMIEILYREFSVSLLYVNRDAKWLTFDNDNYGIGDVIGTIASRYEIKDISVNEPSVESIIRNIYNNRVTLATSSEESLNKCDES